MNIALIAHNNKKELMVQLCIAYCGIFSAHSLCSTNTTSRLITEATGMEVQKYMSRSQGGIQQSQNSSRIGALKTIPTPASGIGRYRF